jgi:hypothetical protein
MAHAIALRREGAMDFIREESLAAAERMYPGIRQLYAWARPTTYRDLLSLYERWTREVGGADRG